MLDEIRRVILKYNTKKKFLRRVSFRYGKDSEGYLLIKQCYELARRTFKGKKRHTGEPYFYHKLAVAVILMEFLEEEDDPHLVAAALLHDLIEDVPGWTEQLLQNELSKIVTRVVAHDVTQLVVFVTKPNKLHFKGDVHEYELATFRKVREGGLRSIKLKLSDRLHNMLTLWGTPEKKLNKTLETLLYVLPMAAEERVLWQELTVACAERITLHRVVS